MNRTLNRAHKAVFEFRAIDAGAKTGAFVLLKDAAGHEHCGRWCGRERAFVYGSSQRIEREIVSYCARAQVAAGDSVPDGLTAAAQSEKEPA